MFKRASFGSHVRRFLRVDGIEGEYSGRKSFIRGRVKVISKGDGPSDEDPESIRVVSQPGFTKCAADSREAAIGGVRE